MRSEEFAGAPECWDFLPVKQMAWRHASKTALNLHFFLALRLFLVLGILYYSLSPRLFGYKLHIFGTWAGRQTHCRN